jgi:peptide/nickel transport system substrate-binding protein
MPTLNPLAISDYVSDQVARFALFSTLVRYDEDLRPEPRLAESWSLNGDSTRLTFRLREGVQWHDGEPLTAEDVAFTFRRAKHPDVGYRGRSYFAAWDSVEVVDRHAVRFHVRPTAGLLYAWIITPIVPEHVLGDVPPGELGRHPFGTRSPVGSGPFRFVEHSQGDRWVFEANPDFPEEMGGPPYAERLIYRVVPDETTLLAETRSGNVHFYMKVLPSQLDRVRADDGLELVTFPFPSYGFVGWNTRRPLFGEAGVRRALTMAIDREEIVDAALNGLGRPATGPLGPWHWAYDSTWSPLPHDPDSARAILERHGWRDTDGDGVRERDGTEFAFELSTNDTRQRRDVAVLVQSQLAEVGVEASPAVREYASLVEAVTGPARDFDAVVLAFQPDLVVDDRDLWACDRRDQPMQFTGYCDEGLDAVLDSLPRTTDRERRRRLLHRYNEIVHRDQPYSFLFFEDRADALRQGLEGVTMDARGELVSVQDWWLRPGARRGE